MRGWSRPAPAARCSCRGAPTWTRAVGCWCSTAGSRGAKFAVRDLDTVLETLATVDALRLPADLDVLCFQVRWSAYAMVPRDLARIAGTALLHADLNAGNVLMTGANARLRGTVMGGA